MPSTAHFDAIYPYLPPNLQSKINRLVFDADGNKEVLDELIKFCYTGPSKGDAQLEEFRGAKRALENGGAPLASSLSSQLNVNKRSRVSSPPKDISLEDDDPLYTIHAISITSPIRKKANITIHKHSVRFTNPATDALEAYVLLEALEMAFLVDTPGKSKAYHTIIMLPKQSTDDEKKPKVKADGADQVVFGVEATSAFRITIHPEFPVNHPKATSTKPFLRDFLSRLPPSINVSEPSIGDFRSSDGKTSIDAYLRAKDGHLYFFNRGILFGEKKPCEWFDVQHIAGVRTLSVTGRTFTLFIRSLDEEGVPGGENDDGMEDGAEESGMETQFSLIEGKELDPVNEWIRRRQKLFGKPVTSAELAGEVASPKDIKGKGKAIPQEGETDDYEEEDDEDFVPSDRASEPGEEFDSEHDSGSERGGENDEGGDDEEEDEEMEWEERHPLRQPGAIPKMSKAAMEMAVGVVEDEFGLSSSSRGFRGLDEDDEDFDEDELEE